MVLRAVAASRRTPAAALTGAKGNHQPAAPIAIALGVFIALPGLSATDVVVPEAACVVAELGRGSVNVTYGIGDVIWAAAILCGMCVLGWTLAFFCGLVVGRHIEARGSAARAPLHDGGAAQDDAARVCSVRTVSTQAQCTYRNGRFAPAFNFEGFAECSSIALSKS